MLINYERGTEIKHRTIALKYEKGPSLRDGARMFSWGDKAPIEGALPAADTVEDMVSCDRDSVSVLVRTVGSEEVATSNVPASLWSVEAAPISVVVVGPCVRIGIGARIAPAALVAFCAFRPWQRASSEITSVNDGIPTAQGLCIPWRAD